MTQGTTQTARTARSARRTRSARSPPTTRTTRTAGGRSSGHVAVTDRGDLVLRVPAVLFELAIVLAVLVGLAAVPFVAGGSVATVGALPLALVGFSALLAATFLAPFAALSLVAVRLA